VGRGSGSVSRSLCSSSTRRAICALSQWEEERRCRLELEAALATARARVEVLVVEKKEEVAKLHHQLKDTENAAAREHQESVTALEHALNEARSTCLRVSS
jgi:hypothetical protein